MFNNEKAIQVVEKLLKYYKLRRVVIIFWIILFFIALAFNIGYIFIIKGQIINERTPFEQFDQNLDQSLIIVYVISGIIPFIILLLFLSTFLITKKSNKILRKDPNIYDKIYWCKLKFNYNMLTKRKIKAYENVINDLKNKIDVDNIKEKHIKHFW